MKVYILNQNGHPLMPSTPAKARKLLRERKAKVINRCPFTLQLQWDCEEKVQEVVVGIDKGSHITGISCASNGEVLLEAEIHHRRDVKEKMDARRDHRRSRRSRKWYRIKQAQWPLATVDQDEYRGGDPGSQAAPYTHQSDRDRGCASRYCAPEQPEPSQDGVPIPNSTG